LRRQSSLLFGVLKLVDVLKELKDLLHIQQDIGF
jgi:hypothetical protein